jgi:hypothetical protein
VAISLASSAAAVTTPRPLRDERAGGTPNVTQFRQDNLYSQWDTDGTTTSPALGNGQQAGFLAQRYSLTPIDPPGPATSNKVLPQLERAVVGFRGGSATQGDVNNRTYGVHTPNASTGLPESLGGTGIYNNLTTGTTLNATSSSVSTSNQINVPWTNFLQSNGADQVVQPPPVVFSISRVGATLTVQIGDQSSGAQWDHVWSATSSAFTEINGFQLRMATDGSSAWRLGDLRFNGQLLESTIGSGGTSIYQADTLTATTAFTEREIFLWDSVSGDFSLTGNLFLGWRVSRPSNATANLQLAFLDLPSDPMPEPASWAMLIAGFGLVGASLRRRRTLAA